VGNLVDLFNQGGAFMWPLLIFSLLTLTFIVERWLALRKAKMRCS